MVAGGSAAWYVPKDIEAPALDQSHTVYDLSFPRYGVERDRLTDIGLKICLLSTPPFAAATLLFFPGRLEAPKVAQ